MTAAEIAAAAAAAEDVAGAALAAAGQRSEAAWVAPCAPSPCAVKSAAPKRAPGQLGETAAARQQARCLPPHGRGCWGGPGGSDRGGRRRPRSRAPRRRYHCAAAIAAAAAGAASAAAAAVATFPGHTPSPWAHRRRPRPLSAPIRQPPLRPRRRAAPASQRAPGRSVLTTAPNFSVCERVQRCRRPHRSSPLCILSAAWPAQLPEGSACPTRAAVRPGWSCLGPLERAGSLPRRRHRTAAAASAWVVPQADPLPVTAI